MAVSNIFKCTGNEVESIPDNIIEGLGMSYEEINSNGSNIANLSKVLQEYRDLPYCRLPFCHTVEAESFGSTVILDHRLGNRISEYAINDIDSIERLAEMNLTKGRISEVLKAVSILEDDGQYVILDVTGPTTIGTSIMSSQLFFRTARKNIDKLNQLLELIEDGTVAYIIEGVKKGVDVFSFADPAGTMDIVGPKVYKMVTGRTTYNMLKKLEGKLGHAAIHLCGKTSTSLEAVGFLDSQIINVDGENYFDMIKNAKKQEAYLIGHWCLKLNKKNNRITKCILK